MSKTPSKQSKPRDETRNDHVEVVGRPSPLLLQRRPLSKDNEATLVGTDRINCNLEIMELEEQIPLPHNKIFLRRNLLYIREARVWARPGRQVHHHMLEQPTDKENPQVVTTCRTDFVCPLCGFDALWEEGIILHCFSDHGRIYDIQYADTPNGVLNLAFRLVPDKDPDVGHGMPTNKLLYWNKRQTVQGADVSYLPARQYYHMGSLDKMLIGEWMLDVDRCDQVKDAEWARELDRAVLNDYDDVSILEKRFFGIWNDFAQCNSQIPLERLPSMCLEFIQKRATLLSDFGLDEQLVWHLTNMWDEGILSRADLVECMQLYQTILEHSKAGPARAPSAAARAPPKDCRIS